MMNDSSKYSASRSLGSQQERQSLLDNYFQSQSRVPRSAGPLGRRAERGSSMSDLSQHADSLPILVTKFRKVPEPLKRKVFNRKAEPELIISPFRGRLTSFCVAMGLELEAFHHTVKSRYRHIEFFDDVLYVSLRADEEGTSNADVFLYESGVVVMWGCTSLEEKKILEALRPFEHEPVPEPEMDELEFQLADTTMIRDDGLGNDEIFVENGRGRVMAALSLSHAVAQSIKLSYFEELVDETVQKTRELSDSLAQTGSIPLSRKQISMYIGEVFRQRNLINLHSGLGETPSWFWDRENLQWMYDLMGKYLELNRRLSSLNSKLRLVKEFYEILNSQIQEQHSTRLEWIVIILILIEIIMSVLQPLLSSFLSKM